MKNKIYLSYQTRLISYIILIVISTIISLFLLCSSFNIFEKNYVDYQETSNINYSVLLKDNNIVEEKEMSSNLNYIANLIDKIKINYVYLFNSEELIKGEYYYNITATLNIVDELTGELYYVKKYPLVETNKEHILKSKLKISDTLNIDYNYYKDIAYKSISYYGEHAKANLNISFNVNKDLDTKIFENNNLNKTVTSNIIIPLTNEEKNIKISSSNYEIEKTLRKIQNYDNKDDMSLLYSIIVDLFIIIFIYKLIKLLKALKVKENKYDKKLIYIRKKYNKLIVDVETQPDFTEYNITKISRFNELLDVRSSYKDPIRFFEVSPHNKCYFYIIHNNEIFLYTLKNVDLEKKKD